MASPRQVPGEGLPLAVEVTLGANTLQDGLRKVFRTTRDRTEKSKPKMPHCHEKMKEYEVVA